jgi:RHS repeat-associated protein
LSSELKFVYDGFKLIEVLDGQNSNAILQKFVWSGDELLSVYDVTASATYYYFADANKNVSELLDSSGNIVAHYEYSPFGKITSSSGSYASTNPFRFSSEYFDSETELVYYNYRYYSPELGRWTKRDPIAEKGGYNLYGMVGNDPINWTDNWGLQYGPSLTEMFYKAKADCDKGAQRKSVACGKREKYRRECYRRKREWLRAQAKNNNYYGDTRTLGEKAADWVDETTDAVETAAATEYTAANLPAAIAGTFIRGTADLMRYGTSVGDATYHTEGDFLNKASVASQDSVRAGNILFMVAGGIKFFKGKCSMPSKPNAANSVDDAAKVADDAANGVFKSSDELTGIEKASDNLIEQIGKKRDLRTGTDIERLLDSQGAEAAMFDGTNLILHKANPSKAALLEEFLHGTQSKLGIINKLGRTEVEAHVKDFMIRHKKMLNLMDEDVNILQQLIDKGL